MKKMNASLGVWVLVAFTGFAQSYLIPFPGYEARDIFPGYSNFQAIDIYDTLLYGTDGDTIRCLDIRSGEPVAKYGLHAGYESFPSFLSVSPDGKELWAGFTVIGNADDRIYRIDLETGDWHLEAVLGGNIDLVWWNDSILVSATNSTSWEAPGSIFLLDTSGQNNHRKIIETGGYTAGLAVDTLGSVYYGTNYAMEPNVLLRWDSSAVAGILAGDGADTLRPDDAVKLSDLVAGPYDIHIDAGGNVLFNMNLFVGDKMIAKWNGTQGDGYNYDVLVIATGEYDWLGYVKSEGNIDSLDPELEGATVLDGKGFLTKSETRNRLIVSCSTRPLAEIYRVIPPEPHPYIDKVWEYKPAPGQFINATPMGIPSSAGSIIGGTDGLLSLGAFGGYLVFSFQKPVENHPDNPYGMDFTIFGNPTLQWSEPGVVWVMKDENRNWKPDDTWYELAGSDHYFSTTVKDYSVSYSNPGGTEAADVAWTDNLGESGFVKEIALHTQPYYPMADSFPGIDPGSYSLSGTRIRDAVDDSNPWMISHRRAFGYADNTTKSLEPLEGSKLASAPSKSSKLASTLPDNPYTREVEGTGGDAFDISWAVDAEGNYVDLDRIHFVKVHTGVMADAKWLGEISTEITGAVVSVPDTSAEGVPEMVVIRDVPVVIDTNVLQLEAYAFDMGRLQPARTINWTSSQPWATVGQDQVLTVTQSGPLTLTAYLADKPEIEAIVTTTVDLSHVSGIKNNNNPEIMIFPNPAGDMVRIDGFDRARVSIYTATGACVLVKEKHAGGESIRLDGLPGGLYIVRITSGRDNVTAPLIKQ